MTYLESIAQNGSISDQNLSSVSKQIAMVQLNLCSGYEEIIFSNQALGVALCEDREIVNDKIFSPEEIKKLSENSSNGDGYASMLIGQYYFDCGAAYFDEFVRMSEEGMDEIFLPPWHRKHSEKKNYDEAQEIALGYFFRAFDKGIMLSAQYITNMWCECRSENIELKLYVDREKEVMKTWKSVLEERLAKQTKERNYEAVFLIKESLNTINLYESEMKLKKVNADLESANEKLKQSNQEREDAIRDQAHTVKNTIQPRGIDSVIRSIRTDPNRREDVLTLHRACQAERKVLQLNALMEIKMQGVELLRHAIQKSVSHEANGDYIKVQYIIDYVFSRMLDDALNPYRYNLSRFRDEIVNRTGQTIRALRASYDDAVVANYARRDKSMMPVWSWFSETVCQLDFQIQPVWKNLYIKSGSVLEILLFKWLNELILNALKYHVVDGFSLLSIALTEEKIRGESFLKINVMNPVDGFSDDSGTLMGLELMKLEIDKINDRMDSFRVDRSPSYFTVTILLKKSLFTAGD